MDKEEYHQKLDELTAYVREKDYENALSIVDSIDWRRVKSINTLNMVADVYEVNKDYKSAKDILVLAYSRASIGRNILYRLVEVCIRLNQIDEAEKYFREFSKVAKNDNSRCLLQYKLFKAKGAPLEAQIDVLEEYKEREYTERWAYELAVLYSKAGDTKKCVETCDDLILWFSEGRYVMKAMELKKQYAALTPSQEQNYNRMKAAANRRKQEQSAGVASEDTESTEEDASARAGIFKEEEREVPESSSFVKRDRNRGEAAGSLESDNQVSGRGKRSEQEHPAESAAVEFKDRLEKGFHHVMHSFTEEGKTVDSGRNRDENAIVDSRRNSGQHAGSDLRRTSDAGRTADTERASDEDLRSDFGRSTDGSQASRVGGSARPSNNPELKQQNSVSERKLTPAAAAAEKARREGTSRKMNTGDFNLDAFLAETAGSFSSEIAAGAAKSETTGDAKAEAPTKAEGAARDAVPVEETEAVEIETPKAEAEIVEEKVSDRTGVKNGTRFEEAEVVEEESPEEAEVVEEESPEEAEVVEEESPEEAEVVEEESPEEAEVVEEESPEEAEVVEEESPEEAEAVEEESPEEAEVVEEESPEEAEVVEEESPEEAEAVEEESPEEAETVEEEVPEATEKSKNLAGGIRLRDLEEEDLSREVTPETLKTGAGTEGAAAGTGSVPSEEVRTDGTSADADSAKPKKKEIHYIEELEIPDPQPSEAERASHTHTIPLDTIGANTVPISIDKILSEETPEERRIRIMNRAKPTRMNEEQRKIFTYFARIPGMDAQILEAISCVYEHAGEKTSLHGNIAVMGARGTGKTRLTHGLVVAMCKDLGMDAAKVARVRGADLNEKDPARVVARMAGGFFIIEDVSGMNEATVEKLSQAMEFRTDCMITIIEDEKVAMRAFLKKYPRFAAKFDRVISIPVFTNDELITFARTYATENGYKIDDMAILALYTMIGNMQTEEEPVTISIVKDMIDKAISRSSAKRRRSRKNKKDKWLVLQEKDFNLT
ncbi:MAG: hypothetical protein SPE66_03850 [Bilifractor sp.]|nr:hypothetical protein [Bilifractor sp.]